MGGCQNYGPFLGPLYNTAPTVYLGYPKGDPNFDNYPHGSSSGAHPVHASPSQARTCRAAKLDGNVVLGGSWVVISGALSPLIWVIIIVALLRAPLITTPEPPSSDP